MTNQLLTVHHLGHSQSERVVWLCEELELDYELKRYQRRKDNRLGPPEYKALHPLGSAPVITDGQLVPLCFYPGSAANRMLSQVVERRCEAATRRRDLQIEQGRDERRRVKCGRSVGGGAATSGLVARAPGRHSWLDGSRLQRATLARMKSMKARSGAGTSLRPG